METRSSKRKKLLQSEAQEPSHHDPDHDHHRHHRPVDRLSDLPDFVLHHILSLLPIKSIAQTSTLSKRWRSLWITFPDLDFTTATTSAPPPSSSSSKRSFSGTTDFIANVLALRDKNSTLRLLRFRARLSFSRLNSLIRRAIRHDVQELDVEVSTEDYFNFPRAVLTSDTLRVFNLKSRYPGFRLPPAAVMKAGFRSLHRLSLSLIILYNQPSLLDLFTGSAFPLLASLSLDACFGLKQLAVGCKALTDLTVENCFQLDGLQICCNKLESLRVVSCFDAYNDNSWVRIDAPRLEKVMWEYNAITDKSVVVNLRSLREASIGFFALHDDISPEKLHSVSNLLSGVSHAHCLTLESQCIEILSNKNCFTVLVLPFHNLTSLKLHTGFNKNNILGLACLFRSSPTLQTLVLKIINDYKIERRQWNRDLWEMSVSEDEQYWESQTQALKSFLQHLKVVKIHGFLECENEISLAKFLLKHGKALQEMTLCTGHCNSKDSLRRQKIRSQMMGFSWASSNAKIAFQ